MQIETTNDTDRECEDLIGEAYEAAYKKGSGLGVTEVWNKIQEVLARKGTLDLCTTRAEDSHAGDVLKEGFREACQTAEDDGFPLDAPDYVDYQQLWGRICDVLEVRV